MLLRVVYYALPNLGIFDIKSQVVHGLPIDPGRIGYAFLYFAVYGSAVLLGACAIFQRRELK